MFHEHFTFCSVSLQEKAKEPLVDKDFQDVKSLLGENRVNLQLIVALDFCQSPLTIALEAVNGFEFDKGMRLFRNKCAIKIARPE